MWRMDRNSPDGRGNRRERKPPRPLDAARLDEMALAYVARFATSAGKLSDYLRRKLRERGWEGEGEADLHAIVSRFVELGYVDDAGFARGKAQSLLRRGYGARRIEQALGAAGIAEPLREEARGSDAERRRAALVMARKRRFGPFGGGSGLDPALREKQVAAMLRAGHPLAYAREVVNASSPEALEEWIDEAAD
ncbi:regulatory protein RecX [Novosphingobium subterraneum]|uniref:Regulatory protein RecX n=2 Tax=Sphingomonadaceae TaxID=41297 RepID=A0A0B9A0G8_9SPHN|nr:regulatory protein RecX [Novosphingobium subterraneum]